MRRLTLKSYLVSGLVFLSGCATSGVAGAGSVDKETIRTVVRARTGAYMSCYEGAIEVRPGAIGKVVTTWDIGPDGRVSNVKFDDVDPTIVDIKPCLEREVLALKFSPTGSNDPIEVRYPFYFDERQSMTIDRLGIVAASSAGGSSGSVQSPDGKLEVKGGVTGSDLCLSNVGDTDSYTKSSNSRSASKLPPDSTGATVPDRAGDIAPSTTSGLPPASNSGAKSTGSSAGKSLSSKPGGPPVPKPSPVVLPLPTVISPSGN